MKAYIRNAVLSVATSAPFSPFHRVLTRDSAAIFMLHRFADQDRGSHGASPYELRLFLGWLRSRGIRLWDLGDLVRSIRRREPLGGGVCFTVDDGYADFATVGMDVFAEFDCPVSVFLATDFIDRTRWMWWDQVRYVLRTTPLQTLEWGGMDEPTQQVGAPHEPSSPSVRRSRRDRPLNSAASRVSAAEETVKSLIPLNASQRDQIIQNLSLALETPLPAHAPHSRFEALTWEEIRTCALRGARFGPHTATHPSLAHEASTATVREIEASWGRVRQMVENPLPVFAYPYGTPDSFGDREAAIVREVGLEGAVTAVPRFVRRGGGALGAEYRLPRFSLPEGRFVQREIATGVLRLRSTGLAPPPAST